VSWAALASKNMTSAVVQGSVSQPKPQATVKPEVKPETTPTAPLPQR